MKKLAWYNLKTWTLIKYHVPTEKKRLKYLDSNKNSNF